MAASRNPPIGSESERPTLSFPAAFASSGDWYQVSTGPVAEGGGVARTWLTNQGFSLEDRQAIVDDSMRVDHVMSTSSFGLTSAEALGAGDVLVIVSTAPASWRPPDPLPGLETLDAFPEQQLPLRLDNAEQASSWGTGSSDDIVQMMLGATIGDSFLDVRVFGTSQPSDLAAEANAQLARIILPDYSLGAAAAPPTFENAAGWHVLSTSTVNADRSAAPQTWASTQPFAVEDLAVNARQGVLWTSGLPLSTVATLPKDGIVIVATATITGGRVVPVGSNAPSVPVNLDLARAEVQLDWEGQSNPDAAQYVMWSGTQNPWIEVRVFFGTQEPSEAALSSAQSMLDSMIIPGYAKE